MFSRTPSLAATAAFALALVGCDANDIGPQTANLTVAVEGTVNGQAYSPAQTYTVNGRAMTFTSGRVYLSNIRLVGDDGSEFLLNAPTPVTLPAQDEAGATVQHTVSNAVVYAPLDLGAQTLALGTVPAGSYRGIRFDVGLAGMTNRVDATQAPVGHPLAKRTDLNNHWSWSSGYIFLRTEGRVDANGDGVVTGTDADAAWNIHLGTAGYVTAVESMEAFEVEGGEQATLPIRVDLAALVSGVNLGDPAQRVCHTMNNVPVANAVKAALPTAIAFDGVASIAD